MRTSSDSGVMNTKHASLNRAVSKQQVPLSLCLCCAVGIFFAPTPRGWAQEDGSPEVIAADVILIRPLCLVATVAGSALFLLSLPVAIATKGTHQTAEKLVALPARATFKRRLGDMSSLTNP